MCIASSQFNELSLFTTSRNSFFNESRPKIMTETKMVKSAHCFDQRVAERTKSINIKTVNFLLCARSVKAFNFTFCSFLLKIGHDYTFKATGLVLSRHECNRLRIEIPTRIRSRLAGVDTGSTGIVG